MQPLTKRLAASLLALLLLPCLPAWGQEDRPVSPPGPVMEAIEAAPAPTDANQVLVGTYINDIQQIDFKTNNYIVDLYVWFRWTNPEIDPAKTMEFMNRFASDNNLREYLYEEPQKMPDGSLYAIVRYQGLFATKFPLEKYPFDRQFLTVIMEDTVSGIGAQIYVPDGDDNVTVRPEITLPGFKVGTPVMQITENTYPTNFGDLSQPQAETYSRIVLTIPVTRPLFAMSLKTFVPILLIVVCASLVFFIRPRYVEGRIGLGITALLTLVALQLTSGASLPDVDYLMMLDKIYLLAYLFIIIILARVAITSWKGEESEHEVTVSRSDRFWAVILLAAYLFANAIVIWTALA